MKVAVGVTESEWAKHLRAHDDIFEVNFWVLSARPFTGRMSPGEPFLFKSHYPERSILGGGFYEAYWDLRVSEAWAAFGQGNGRETEELLEATIQRHRENTGKPWQPDPTIGCVILRNPFFASSSDEFAQPPHWARGIVQGKVYNESDRDFEYVNQVFRALQGRARIDVTWDPDLYDVRLDAPQYGAPILTKNRLGQGQFRLGVFEAYDYRCAITDSRTVAGLDAAHIRDYARGGRYLVTNGIALRSDLHRLFDRGYLGIDTDYRLRVSPALRISDTGNGVSLHEREERGQAIRPPGRPEDLPDQDALDWHMRKRFRAA